MKAKELIKLAEEAQIKTGLYIDKISGYDETIGYNPINGYDKINLKQWKEKITAENREKEKERYDKKIADWREKHKWYKQEKKPEKPDWRHFDTHPSDYCIARFYLGNKDETGDIEFWYEPLSQEILENLISAQKTHQFKRFEIWIIKPYFSSVMPGGDSSLIMVGFSCWLDEWGYHQDATHLEEQLNRFIYKICEWNSTRKIYERR